MLYETVLRGDSLRVCAAATVVLDSIHTPYPVLPGQSVYTYQLDSAGWSLVETAHSSTHPLGCMDDPVVRVMGRSVINLSPLVAGFSGFPKLATSKRFRYQKHQFRNRLPQTLGQQRLLALSALMRGNTSDLQEFGQPSMRIDSALRRDHTVYHPEYQGEVISNMPINSFPINTLDDLPENVFLGYHLPSTDGDPVYCRDSFYIPDKTHGTMCRQLEYLLGKVSASVPVSTTDNHSTYLVDLDFTTSPLGVVSDISWTSHSIWNVWNSPYRFRDLCQCVAVLTVVNTNTGPLLYGDHSISEHIFSAYYTIECRRTTFMDSKVIEVYPGPNNWIPVNHCLDTYQPNGTFTSKVVLQPYFACDAASPDVSSNTETPFTILEKSYASTDSDIRYVGLAGTLISSIEFELGNEIFSDTNAMRAVAWQRAVDDSVVQLMMNNLANIQQMNLLAPLIDSFKLAIQIYRDLKAKDYVSATYDFISFVSNAFLLYKFGICTTLSDARTFVKGISKVIEAIVDADYFKPVHVRGTFKLAIPDGELYRYTGLSAVSHCHGVLRWTQNSFMAALMPTKAIGLYPSLVNLWDLARWSFIIDWYTNIDDRLAIVDSQFQSAIMMDVTGVTSSVEIRVPLDKFLSNAEDDRMVAGYPRPYVSLYQRVKEAYAPSFYPTRLDYFPAKGLTWDRVLIGAACVVQVVP